MPQRRDLISAAVALVALPFALSALGLGVTSASEVVIFGIACMALNILVGYTGLVSFGHGAWFGVAAYAAALTQRNVPASAFLLPLAAGLASVLALSWAFGYLILRRRGVYFSLLTLALAAMLYAVAFRWTEVTGGENGLGGIVRPVLGPVSFENPVAFYVLVAVIAFAVVLFLWRFHRSPLGTVLVAIRENEQRARFVGYPTNRYKLIAFTTSAVITGLAGILLTFNTRMTSADPVSVAFSGELLAMVIIGGMRSFLGPALGALFYVIFRDSLSRVTENWLLYFGLLFVAFVVLSPEGLMGVYGRIARRGQRRRDGEELGAMAEREQGEVRLPEFLKPGRARGAAVDATGNAAVVPTGDAAVAAAADAPVVEVRDLHKSFGGIKAVRGLSFAMADRKLHALIGPNGAGKTTAFNVISGMFRPDQGTVTLAGRSIVGLSPERITRAGVGRSFQITNLFTTLSVEENVRLAVQARHPKRFWFWVDAHELAGVSDETAAVMRTAGLAGMETAQAALLSYGGQRLVDMALALATQPRVLLLDEPLAGLAAAERDRVGRLIKAISADLPVLLVEHDIDRVFALADAVTVMNDGEVLVDGTAAEARDSRKVQEIYIGSGTHALAGQASPSAAKDALLATLSGVNTYYGKSHILHDVGFDVRENEVVALLGRNGAGKSTLLKTIVGIVPPATGSIELGTKSVARRPSAEIARAGVAYVPQGRGLYAGMSLEHNLELGRLKRRNGQGVYWSEERIYEFFPRLAARRKSAADHLSGGEQQMLAVARALAGDTRLLLLDEPFEGLAPSVIEELFVAFDKLRQELSIIIVDHHLDLALALSDRTVVLEHGQVVYRGVSGELAKDEELRRKVLWV